MLTPAQSQSLRTAIHADTNITALVNARDVNALVTYLSADSSSIVWRSTTSAADVLDAVQWASLTPTDVPDGTALYTNRALMCQAKQINLQVLLQGVSSVSTGKPNIRIGLQDALTNVPSGVSGALVAAGWAAVKTAISRPANLFEAVFATGTKTASAPGVLVVEGTPSLTDIAEALYYPDGSMK